MTFEIEFHPENGREPYVVVVTNRRTMRLWFAFETLAASTSLAEWAYV